MYSENVHPLNHKIVVIRNHDTFSSGTESTDTDSTDDDDDDIDSIPMDVDKESSTNRVKHKINEEVI